MLAKEIESWEGFAESLGAGEDRTLFIKMLTDCHNYAKAINAKGQPFSIRVLDYAAIILTT